MARVRADERLVENEIGLLESGLDVADLPFVGVLTEREFFGLCRAEVFAGPLQFLHLRIGGPGRLRRTHPHVAVGSRVRASGPETLEWIDDERQRLEIDLNLF